MENIKIKNLNIKVNAGVNFNNLESLNYRDRIFGAIFNNKVFNGGNSIKNLEVCLYDEIETLKSFGIELDPKIIGPSLGVFARVDEIIVYPKGKASNEDGMSFKVKGLRPFTLDSFHYLCGKKIDNVTECIKNIADFTGSVEFVIDGSYDPENNIFDTTPYRDKKHILVCVYWSEDERESRLSNITHGFKNKHELKEKNLHFDTTYQNAFKHTGHDYIIMSSDCIDNYEIYHRY